jgi:hypothetical protein
MMEAERPQPNGVSSEAPREQVLQGEEREGWPGSSERASEGKRRPAQHPRCEARTWEFVCRWEAADEAAQDKQSGSQEDATPTGAEKDENGGTTDESDLLTEDCDRAGLRGPADRGSHRSLGWDPGGLTMGHKCSPDPARQSGECSAQPCGLIFPCRLLYRETG